MPKPIKQTERPRDVNQWAKQMVDLSTRENSDTIERLTKPQISMLMSELGRKGGKIGGKRRLETMTAKKRTLLAKRAAQARWKRNPDTQQ